MCQAELYLVYVHGRSQGTTHERTMTKWIRLDSIAPNYAQVPRQEMSVNHVDKSRV